MTEAIMFVFSIVAFGLVPASALAVYIAWRYVIRYPSYKLPKLLATGNTIGFVVATGLGAFAIYRISGGVSEDWMLIGLALGFLTLDALPLLNTSYLIWLDRVGRYHEVGSAESNGYVKQNGQTTGDDVSVGGRVDEGT